MNHINNISKLFSKNFVESPLLESFDAGKIHVSSGYLVASDPLITHHKDAFEQVFPLGDFPVLVHKERESNCIAYAEIQFGKEEIVNWKMATCKNQNITELKEGEIFGYPVESGMGCFMDAETQDSLNQLEQLLYERKGEDFMGIYEEFFHEHFFDEKGAIDQYAFLKPKDNHLGNIFAFETGYGEGFYASYVGYDANKKPVKIITEFIEILVN